MRRSASYAIEFAKPVPLHEAGSLNRRPIQVASARRRSRLTPARVRPSRHQPAWSAAAQSPAERPRGSPRDTGIVLGVLIEIFRGDRVAADRGLARKGDVALKDLVGAAADLHARAIAVEGLVTLRRPLLLRLEWPITVIASARRALA